jgi:hypothetical protein
MNLDSLDAHGGSYGVGLALHKTKSWWKKRIDEWTRAALFPKVKFLYQDSDLAVD